MTSPTNTSFISKTISLPEDFLLGSIVKSETLSNQTTAQNLLAKARAEAAAIRQQAETEKQDMLTQMSEDFLHSSNQLLADLQQKVGSILQTSEPKILLIIKKTLEQLCFELSDKQIQTAMLKQIRSVLANNKPATLYCQPEHQELLTQLFNDNDLHAWKIKTSSELPEGTLIAEDDQGQYQTSMQLTLEKIQALFQSSGN